MTQGLVFSPGLVLRLRPYGESDLLADLFTRELGRVTALAKGARKSQKRFFGLLLAAHCLDLDLRPPKGSGSLWWLEGAELKTPYLGLRRDYQRYMTACPVLELLLRGSAWQDPHPRAFDLALLTLERMARAKSLRDSGSALVVFVVRLLKEMGYGLNLQGCVRCGRPLGDSRNCRLSHEGGMVCGECPPGVHSMEAPPGLVKGLRAAVTLQAGATQRLSFPPGVLAPTLFFLANFWRAQLRHDLPALALAQRLLN